MWRRSRDYHPVWQHEDETSEAQGARQLDMVAVVNSAAYRNRLQFALQEGHKRTRCGGGRCHKSRALTTSINVGGHLFAPQGNTSTGRACRTLQTYCGRGGSVVKPEIEIDTKHKDVEILLRI